MTTNKSDFGFLHDIVKKLVRHPDKVRFDSGIDGQTASVVVTVDDEDYGKLIGKNGQMFDSLRTLLEFAARKSGYYRCRLQLPEPRFRSLSVPNGTERPWTASDDTEIERLLLRTLEATTPGPSAPFKFSISYPNAHTTRYDLLSGTATRSHHLAFDRVFWAIGRTLGHKLMVVLLPQQDRQ